MSVLSNNVFTRIEKPKIRIAHCQLTVPINYCGFVLQIQNRVVLMRCAPATMLWAYFLKENRFATIKQTFRISKLPTNLTEGN